MREIGCHSDIDDDHLCPNLMSKGVNSCPSAEKIIDHLRRHSGRISAYPLSCDAMISRHNDDCFLFYTRQALFANTCHLYGDVFEPPKTAYRLR